MGRILWTAGEVVAGVLLGGLVSGVGVSLATRRGWPTGPWMLWVSLALGVAVCLVAGERFRRSLRQA